MSDEKEEDKATPKNENLSPSEGVPASPPPASQEEELDWGQALAEQKKVEEGAMGAAGVVDDWAAALNEQTKEEDKVSNKSGSFKAPNVERAKLEDLKSSASPHGISDDSKLEIILDIPVSISMEVGKTNISIRNLLKLTQGSVVELDRFAGDALDVYVNGKLIAHGEVVVVNEKFGIRLTDVISAAERITELG